MRKFGKESAAPAEKGAVRDESGNGWLKSHWCVLALGIIVIVAFLLRFVFAYSVSADGDYALSGGTSAQYHLHVIESILNGSWSMTDASVNYPIGGSLYIPPLMDFLAAGVATLFQGGMGTTEAASMSLAVLNPILGALACIPVYMIGRELFDKKIGVVAALIFAFLALPISTSVFSSGNEYALAAFLLAFMAYFLIKMVKAADAENATRKGVLLNGVIAGIFLMLASLTWTGFRIAVVLLVVAMVLQAVVSRVRGKDFADITLGYVAAILIGTLIPAAYYVPAGLMDAVYSGSLIIAIVSVVFVLAFLALKAKPWVVTIPACIIAFIVFCIVFAVAVPDTFNDFFFGNSVYSSSIMEQLSSDRVSMSNVAAYYGWLTMWLPICLALYETYVYCRKNRSATQLFMVVWLYVMFFAAWTSYATAAVVGSVFAVGSAALIVKILKAANLREWASNIKAAGFPGCFRKLIKPLPFASVIVVAFLVIVPNVSFAVDAGIPSNTEDDGAFYAGNTSFTIKTGDSYPVGDIWDSYEDQPKDGAIVTWIDYAYDAVSQAGFSNVVDSIGGGSSAAAQMYLADGSAGAIAAMMMRIIMSDSDNYASCFTDSSVYSIIAGYVDDPASAKAEINGNPDIYGKVRSDITDENAVYLASVNYIASNMSEADIMSTYDAVCQRSGDKIGYLLLDGSMLPLQYNDGDNFSTIAYFAGYSVDGYGAATEFYSYNTYYGYTQYTSEIYDTLMWKALIGPSATEAGYTSSYSYLVALSSSDGSEDSAKAIPGYGLAGFTVAQWLVLYNPDSEASGSSDGWEYMDGWEAMEKQKTDGGLINYLYGIVMLEYTGSPSGSSVLDGSVVSSDGSTVSGATVSVYQYSETYGQYVLFSETRTFDGEYSALVPSGDYKLEVKIGDLVLASHSSGSIPSTITITESVVEGEVQVNGEIYKGENMMVELESDADSATVDVVDGKVTLSGILPGTYSYTLYGNDGTSLGTGEVTIYPGDSVGFVITPTTRTITVTVEDETGQTVDPSKYGNPTVTATNTTTGAQFTSEIGEDGKAVISVISGTYTISAGDGLVSIYSTTQTVSSSNRTATVTAYPSKTIEVNDAPDCMLTASAGEFSTIVKENGGIVSFDIPVGMATVDVGYTVYGVSGSTVYWAVLDSLDDESVTIQSSQGRTVSGKLLDGSSGTAGSVTLQSENGFSISVATDDEGEFSIVVPDGTYTVSANDGDDKVYIGSVTVNGDRDMGDLSMVDGRRINSQIRYDPATTDSNINLPFVQGTITFTYSGQEYTLTSMSGTSGNIYFYIPDSVDAETKYNGGVFENEYFKCEDLSRDVTAATGNTSSSHTIQYVGYTTDQKNVVKQMSYTAPYDMELIFHEDEETTIEMKAGETKDLCPGQYDIVISGETGYYFDGTAYLYPGQTEFVGLDVDEVVAVNITKDEGDVLTIESEGSYHSFDGGYYLEKGYEYYLTCKDPGSDDLQYGYVDLTEDAQASYTLNMNPVETMEVTGYVGISADGTLTITSGDVKHEFDIEDGAYTLVLPTTMTSVDAAATVTNTVDSVVYTFKGTASFTGMTDGSIRNLKVVSTETEPDEDEEPDDFEVTVSASRFSNGIASVELSVKNNTDSAMTYLISAGSAWSLDRAFTVTVPADSTGSCVITGTYDATRVAPGLDGVDVTVSDMNGNDVTVDIDQNSAPTTGSEGMDILVSGDDGAENDKVSASQYMYAVTFVNKDNYSKQATFGFSVSSGWYATVMDADGKYVGEIGDAVTIYGLQTVTYYISLMQASAESGSSTTVPSISVTVSGDASETLSLTPVAVQVETDSTSASGGNSLNERSGMPAGIWFLLAVMILMIIAIFWLASKRGVFARK